MRRLAGGLYNHGLKKGDVVFALLPNCIEYPVILHAVTTLGGILCTCNPEYIAGNEMYNCIVVDYIKLVIASSIYVRYSEVVIKYL